MAKTTLHTLLGDYGGTAAVKKGEVTSDLVTLSFADVKTPNTAFKRLVRDAEFDVGELAIVTFLQAKAFGKPYVLMPAVVVGRGQIHTIAYNSERGTLKPGDLAGKRVGVRAYSVTTGVWVRGLLADQYGVDLDKVRWVTFEDPHVAEYHDPAIAERAPAGKQIAQMLIDGELDAAVLGNEFPDPRLKRLVPDAEAVDRQWAEAHGGVPINHMVVVRDAISKARPDVVKEVFRLLQESRKAAGGATMGTPLDPLRFGVEKNRRTLDAIIGFTHRQGLIPRRFSVDELFDDTTRALGT